MENIENSNGVGYRKIPGVTTMKVMSIIGICLFSLLFLELMFIDDYSEVLNGVDTLASFAGEDTGLTEYVDNLIGSIALSSIFGLAMSIVVLVQCGRIKNMGR